MAEFDGVSSNYQELVDGSIGITGENSDYFAAYKARYISSYLAGANGGPWGKLLDYGCGVGLLSGHLKRCSPEKQIDGFDVSESSLRRIDPALLSQGVFTSKLDRLGRDYGVVVLANVLHHVKPDERRAVISEAASRLIAGGKLVIFEHNPFNPLTRWAVSHCPFDEGVVLLPSSEVRALCASSLPSLRTDYIVFFPRWLALLRPLERFLKWCPAGAQHATVARKAG